MKKKYLFLVSAFLGFGGVIIVSFGLWMFRPEQLMNGQNNLGLTIIPAPSATMSSEPTLLISDTAQPSTPAPFSGKIKIKDYVQVNGTEGEGLRLRDEPGVGNTILTLASDAEIYIVLEGPSQADGYQWWYVADPYNEKRRGWAVENYLIMLQ